MLLNVAVELKEMNSYTSHWIPSKLTYFRKDILTYVSIYYRMITDTSGTKFCNNK